jgi:hypothetical protein
MKILFRTNRYLVALGVVACAVILYGAQYSAVGARTGKIQIMPTGVVIHPTVELSAADELAIDNVLQEHDKSLYKIETVENGQIIKVQGELKDAHMTAALKAEMTAGTRRKHGKSIQAICEAPCHQTQLPPIWSNTEANSAERQQLIKELTPILKNYQ